MVSTRFLHEGARFSVPPCSPWWLPCGTWKAGSVPRGTALAGALGVRPALELPTALTPRPAEVDDADVPQLRSTRSFAHQTVALGTGTSWGAPVRGRVSGPPVKRSGTEHHPEGPAAARVCQVSACNGLVPPN